VLIHSQLCLQISIADEQQTIGGLVQVGIIKNNERTVVPELKSDLLQAICANL
jgi:hypothetical protein